MNLGLSTPELKITEQLAHNLQVYDYNFILEVTFILDNQLAKSLHF